MTHSIYGFDLTGHTSGMSTGYVKPPNLGVYWVINIDRWNNGWIHWRRSPSTSYLICWITWRYISEENPVRVIDVFADNPDLAKLGFKIYSALTVPLWLPPFHKFLVRESMSRQLQFYRSPGNLGILSYYSFLNRTVVIFCIKYYGPGNNCF